MTGLSGSVNGIDSTPDGRMILFSASNNLYGYWTENGTIALNMTRHAEPIREVEVSPDGRYVATGSNDNTVKIIDISSQTVVRTIQASSDVYDIEFSPDGGTIVVARGRQASMFAYRTDTWSSLGSMEGFGNNNNNRGVYAIAFDGDGDTLVVGWRRGYTSLHMSPDAYIRVHGLHYTCLLYTSPSPRDRQKSRMPSSA